MKNEKSLQLALSIDHSKVAAVSFETTNSSSARIHGFASRQTDLYSGPTLGSIQATADALLDVIEDIESQTNTHFYSAGITFASQNTFLGGFTTLQRLPSGQVTRGDLNMLQQDLTESDPLSKPESSRVCYFKSFSDYLIDQHTHTPDPIGLAGSVLARTKSLFLDDRSHVSNILSAVRQAGLKVNTLVPQPLANAHSVASEDERENGVIVIDIGKQLTQITGYRRGAPVFAKVLSCGSHQVTKDLSICLHVPLEEAEHIKRSLHCFATPSANGPREFSHAVAEARLNEHIDLIGRHVDTANSTGLSNPRILLTGGGSKQRGVLSQMKRKVHPLCRLSSHFNFQGFHDLLDDPSLASLAGLVALSQKGNTNGYLKPEKRQSPESPRRKVSELIRTLLPF